MLILDKIIHKDMFLHKASNLLCGCTEEPVEDGDSVVLLTEGNQELVIKIEKLQSDFIFFNSKTRQAEEFVMLEGV